MFALFNARRNPAKVPVQLLTRATLDAVGKAYTTRKLVPDSNPDAAVLRDYMLDLGIETLRTPDTPDFQEKQGSALHRWIVLDAIESAESVPQRDTWKAVIAATRAWVNDPSERNRLNAEHMKDIGYKERTNDVVQREGRREGHPAASSAVRATTASRNYDGLGSIGGASSAAYAAYEAASARSTSALTAYDSALTRYRILVHLAEAGVLPEPPKLDTRS